MPDQPSPKFKLHPAAIPSPEVVGKAPRDPALKVPRWRGYVSSGTVQRMLRERQSVQIVRSGSRVAYAEVACMSNFTFLTGASHPDELVQRAAELGHKAVGIADVNTLAGVVRGHVAAEKLGLPFIVGARLVLGDGTTVIAYPTDVPSYGRLCRLLTVGKMRCPDGPATPNVPAGCDLGWADLAMHAEGLVGVYQPHGDAADAQRLARLLRIFGKQLSVAAACGYGENDRAALRRTADLAEHLRVPLLATNDVQYHDPTRRMLHDALACIRHGCTLESAGYRLAANGERHLKPPEEIARLFADYPAAIARSVEIAEQTAGFSLGQLKYQYPSEVVPADRTAMQHLTELSRAGMRRRFPEGPPEHVIKQFEHELVLIEELNIPHYFLTVEDLVRWSREQGILCQGRGAAANSIVCYSLGITDADPRQINTLFERFVSRERKEPPDIDIDFEHNRREEAIQYLYRKYGRDRAALTANVITYRGRLATRELGKVLGFSPDAIDRLAKGIDWWKGGLPDADAIDALKLKPDDAALGHLANLVTQLCGFPRHLSQHPGGFVLTETPLCELVPIGHAAMPDRTRIEWDKDDIDALGFIKVDVLGLGMLTALAVAARLQHDVRCRERRRDEETKRRSAQKWNQDGTSKNIPGSDGLAESDVTVPDDLPTTSPAAGRGTIWTGRPDAPRGGVGAVKHRRGIRSRKQERPTEVFEGFPRLAQRVDDTVRVEHQPRVAQAQPTNARLDERNGPRPPSLDPEFGEEREIATTSSLRLFVSSSLSWEELYRIFSPPDDDPPTYAMIQRADTVGVFQIESRAQMSMLPRLRPSCYYDLVIEVAIVRPGPIQGGMVHPYLRRRRGLEPVTYPTPEIKRILGKTLGVPLFQEQAMLMAIHCAGFTPDEADQLRRAVTGFRRFGDIDDYEGKIINGMIANGYDRAYAERCFKQIQGFSTYGFPESHASSFALITYASCYLKCHHPSVFLAAMLNSQPLGFYGPAQLVQDAQRHGVVVRPMCVMRSDWDCTLEPCEESAEGVAVRLGMRMAKGMRETDAEKIIATRAGCRSVMTIWQRSGATAHSIKALAAADAFTGLGIDRKTAVWQAGKLRDTAAPLFDGIEDEVTPTLPTTPPLRDTIRDYATTGLTLRQHPIAFLRDRLPGVTPAADLADAKRFPKGTPITVAGLCLCRQRPGSANSITFMTLEDETGCSNLVVFPNVFDREQRVARHSTAMKVTGRIDRDTESGGVVVHVIAERFESLDADLSDLQQVSRNFR